MANSADPDEEANWSGSTLFVKDTSGLSRTKVKFVDWAIFSLPVQKYW